MVLAANIYDATYMLGRVSELVAAITTNCTWVYRGQTVYVDVTVSNSGDSPESVWVILYYNMTAGKSIDTYPVYLDTVSKLYTSLYNGTQQTYRA